MAKPNFLIQYSKADQILHRMAFSSRGLQESLADIEDRLYAKPLAQIRVEHPVFLTALPRAGTTLMLNMLHATGDFVSHTYRDMPFTMCPVIWNKMSHLMRSKQYEWMERAHGDGIAISVESAEAFEEILWHHFWPNNYQSDRIVPWGIEADDDFSRFFKNHIRKLIWLQQPSRKLHYLSKNNHNISRLPFLHQLFSDARIVVLFRDPIQHTASLLKQHLNFLALHEQQPFSRIYMKGIGHFDFGTLLLPINFDHWLTDDRRSDSKTLTFWMEYWVATYRALLSQSHGSRYFLSFDQWSHRPELTFEKLATLLGLSDAKRLTEQSTQVHPPKPHSPDVTGVSDTLMKEAYSLHEQLVIEARAWC